MFSVIYLGLRCFWEMQLWFSNSTWTSATDHWKGQLSVNRSLHFSLFFTYIQCFFSSQELEYIPQITYDTLLVLLCQCVQLESSSPHSYQSNRWKKSNSSELLLCSTGERKPCGFWNGMRVKLWQNVHFGLNYSFKMPFKMVLSESVA